MDAMILAAGLGRRMRPLTESIPKPLVQVGELTLIEHHLQKLALQGFKRVVINISYLHEIIKKYFHEHHNFGLELIFSIEKDGPFGTAGGIVHALELLETEQILVINGDVFTCATLPCEALDPNVDCHLMMVRNPDHNSSGDFLLNNNRLQLMKDNEVGLTYSGIGIYRRSLFEQLSPGFAELGPVIRQLIEQHRATAALLDDVWIDVGTLERLNEARQVAQRQIKT